jgi:hypothetical protein
MQAYQILYPYAVICMAIVASLATMIGGLYSFIVIVGAGKTWALAELQKNAKRENMIIPTAISPGEVVPYVLAGTAIFVAACLAAMIELKIGAWVASIGCQ